jgi:threonine/homoserine/homoserine lactone efflux protein
LSNIDGNTTADNIVALDNVVIENSAVIIFIVANFVVVAVIVSLAKPFLDMSKIEFFGRENFRRWQERIFGVLDMHEVVWVLTDPKTNDNVKA